MRFFSIRPTSFIIGALCIFLSLVEGRRLEKRSTQVSLQSYTYSGSTLAGSIKVQNIAYQKTVSVYWAQGSNWQSTPIAASYSSGPDSSGYEYWTFSGTAASATQFYISYVVNGNTYYDPGNYVNYQISSTSTTSTTSNAVSTTTTKATTSAGGTTLSISKVSTTKTATSSAPVGTSTLDVWLSSEYTTAEYALKRNIGSSDNTLIPVGVVVASPSTANPNYYYQWIRDASVVMEHLVNEYLADGSSNLQYILNWITAQYNLQRVNNPSGSYTSGGLGEPKFNVDGTAFTGAWGRPQRDGPALRAATLMKFATYYNNIDSNYVKTKLYDGLAAGSSQTVIKADLDYVVSYWSQSSFDLWEEVNGQHFFTTLVSYRAMIEGATFAKLMGDSSSATTYTNTASSMVSTIQQFWRSDKGYLIETLNTGRSGLDCGTLLGSLRARDYIYKPSSQEVLATADALVSSMQSIYAINSNSGPGYAVGRYPEDVYDGNGSSQGNPWFICTTTVAHTLYAAVQDFQAAGSISVTSTSLKLFQRAYPSAATGTYAAGTPTYTNILASFKTLGDGFLNVVKAHAYTNGSLNEQFNRNTGSAQGARDLTWSYEAILEAIRARNSI